MKNKNFIFWALQLIFDISILIALFCNRCFNPNINKYKENPAYSVYTTTRTYKIIEEPDQTYDYLSAIDNIKSIHVKYEDDKIICTIKGWNGKKSILEFNRSEHIIIDYL